MIANEAEPPVFKTLQRVLLTPLPVSNVEIRGGKLCNEPYCGRRAPYVVEYADNKFYRHRLCWKHLPDEAVGFLEAWPAIYGRESMGQLEDQIERSVVGNYGAGYWNAHKAEIMARAGKNAQSTPRLRINSDIRRAMKRHPENYSDDQLAEAGIFAGMSEEYREPWRFTVKQLIEKGVPRKRWQQFFDPARADDEDEEEDEDDEEEDDEDEEEDDEEEEEDEPE